jgi:hypothetical protein
MAHSLMCKIQPNHTLDQTTCDMPTEYMYSIKSGHHFGLVPTWCHSQGTKRGRQNEAEKRNKETDKNHQTETASDNAREMETDITSSGLPPPMASSFRTFPLEI